MQAHRQLYYYRFMCVCVNTLFAVANTRTVYTKQKPKSTKSCDKFLSKLAQATKQIDQWTIPSLVLMLPDLFNIKSNIEKPAMGTTLH